MQKILIIVIIIEVIAATTLKLFNVFYHKNKKYLEKKTEDNVLKENLLSSEVSYTKYKEISKKASVPNSPVRINGDFIDFLISHIMENDNFLENNIMNIDYEEFYE